jgi:hypothetical protein
VSVSVYVSVCVCECVCVSVCVCEAVYMVTEILPVTVGIIWHNIRLVTNTVIAWIFLVSYFISRAWKIDVIYAYIIFCE